MAILRYKSGFNMKTVHVKHIVSIEHRLEVIHRLSFVDLEFDLECKWQGENDNFEL